MRRIALGFLFGCGALLALVGLTQPVAAEDAAPTPQSVLEGAELVGKGPISVYSKKGNVILSLPREAFGRPFIWYSEVVGLPAGVVSDSLEAASILAQLERHGDRVVVRDLNARAALTGGDGLPGEQPAPVERVPGSPDQTPFPERPIDVALNMIQTPPAIAAFPVAAEGLDGTVLIDVTQVFSGDIESASARSFVALTGMVPAAVDPARSYIERARTGTETLNIRTHLTFLATNPQNPASGMKPVSIVIGHSFVFLPEKPMAARRADKRIGYFTAR
ncbi:MAG: DUF5117 domain-containing protein, partial [Nitratireductor sp.]|nr:DUF5117 domain-containing protein [Nitratireductor sp.]